MDLFKLDNAHGGAKMPAAARLKGLLAAQSRFVSASVLMAAFAAAPLVTYAAPDAGEQPVESVANTPYSATFIVNANAVYVRAGPALSYYPTMKLDKGSKVKAVGMKLDWLKIVPPEGSFCYISKAHVDRNGDGSVGRVVGDAVNVRAGSLMNAMKVQVLCQLSAGEEVKILGEQDEYYKIAPPAGKAFLYIRKDNVDPDPESVPEKQTPAVATKNEPAAPKVTPAPQPQQPAQPQPTDNVARTETPTAPANGNKPAAPSTTQPSQQPGAVAKAPASTQPSDTEATAEAEFARAEADYADANNKPLDQQPIAKLIGEYEPLAASDKLTNTLHRIAEQRLATLKLRDKSAQELAKAKEAQEAMRKRQLALKEEGKELEDRLKTQGVSIYTAVGELQMSSLQLNSKTLYRLTDPANERTVCYIRTDDPKFVTYLGKFIGVKGELSTEPQLQMKVVSPSDVANVDPTKVNRGVSATIVPPSMVATDDASAAAHVETNARQ
jgi:uncharacterized protein YgiM (DUF1202 family)